MKNMNFKISILVLMATLSACGQTGKPTENADSSQNVNADTTQSGNINTPAEQNENTTQDTLNSKSNDNSEQPAMKGSELQGSRRPGHNGG